MRIKSATRPERAKFVKDLRAMRTQVDCIPCFVQQAIEAARLVTDDPQLQARLVRGPQ